MDFYFFILPRLMHELNARAATKYNPTDAANEKKLLEVIAMQIN